MINIIKDIRLSILRLNDISNDTIIMWPKREFEIFEQAKSIDRFSTLLQKIEKFQCSHNCYYPLWRQLAPNCHDNEECWQCTCWRQRPQHIQSMDEQVNNTFCPQCKVILVVQYLPTNNSILSLTFRTKFRTLVIVTLMCIWNVCRQPRKTRRTTRNINRRFQRTIWTTLVRLRDDNKS